MKDEHAVNMVSQIPTNKVVVICLEHNVIASQVGLTLSFGVFGKCKRNEESCKLDVDLGDNFRGSPHIAGSKVIGGSQVIRGSQGIGDSHFL